MRSTLPNITSLRFFLALLVVIYHIPQFCANRGWPSFSELPIFNKGTEAVYVFFSLSGFLIIKNLFEEKLKKGTISIKQFYKRRILRIFPLYYAVLIFGLLYYNLILPHLGFEMKPRQYSLLEGIVLGGTFFPNILAIFQPGGILEILWSIGIEEQFYLIIAPLFLLLPTKKVPLFLLLFTVVYFVAFYLDYFKILRDGKMYFYYFSISGLAAVSMILHPNLKIFSFAKIFIYLIFLLYLTTSLFTNNLSKSEYQFFSMILFPLFILCIIQTPYKILENEKVKYLGKISYGIYMLHAIVMQLTGFAFLYLKIESLQLSPMMFIIIFNLITILSTIWLAHLSYRYFESFFFKAQSVKIKFN